MKTIGRFVSVIALLAGFGAVMAPAAPAYAAPPCNARLLTFPAWYNGLPMTGDCAIKSPTTEEETQKFITRIILNIIDILMQLVAYASTVFLIIGGFRYLTSAGSPEGMKSAGKTMLNAIIGLVIAIVAVTIVNLVGASIV